MENKKSKSNVDDQVWIAGIVGLCLVFVLPVLVSGLILGYFLYGALFYKENEESEVTRGLRFLVYAFQCFLILALLVSLFDSLYGEWAVEFLTKWKGNHNEDEARALYSNLGFFYLAGGSVVSLLMCGVYRWKTRSFDLYTVPLH